jgi:AbrB family looped-hinge helix DNA binding protein
VGSGRHAHCQNGRIVLARIPKVAIPDIILPLLHRWEIGMPIKDTAKLSAKFQISIPKAVRGPRHWQAGQEFAFIPKGEGVLLVPVPKREDLSGLAHGAAPENYRDRKDRF